MKKFLSCILVVLLATVSICAAAETEAPVAEAATEAPAQKVYTPDELLAFIPEVVATINGQTAVSRDDIVNEIRPQIEFALAPENQGKIPVTPEIVRSYAYQLASDIANTIAIQTVVNKADIKVTDEEINAELDSQLAILTEQVGGADKLQEILTKMNKTLNDLRDEAKGELTEGIKLRKYFETVIVPPTEEEIKALYEENKAVMTQLSASHILIKYADTANAPSDEEKATVLEKIKAVKARIDAGEDFAEVAKEVSDCPSGNNGGDLGIFAPGQMVPEFEAALLTLKEGEISGPVETMFGYHLIKAGKCEAKSLEEVRPGLVDYLNLQAKNAAAQKLIDEADIKILLPEE